MKVVHANGVALLAALAWGLGNVSQKTILDHLDGYSASGLTSLVGAVVLLPFAQRESRQALPPPAGSGVLMLKVAALFTLAATLMQFGYGHSSVTNMGFLVNTAAAITPIIGWICFRQHPPVGIWLACLCALMGVFLMSGAGWNGGLNSGDVLALAAAFAFAFWTLLLGQYVMRYRRPILVTLVQLLICGVICVGLGAFTYGLPVAAALYAALPEILFLGAMSKGLAYVLIATAQQHIHPSCAAVIVSAEAVFGSLLAMVLLNETLGFAQTIGAGCILVGIVIAAGLPAPVNDARLR